MTALLLALGATLWVAVILSLWLNPPLRAIPPGKTITITGKPVEIVAMESFRVEILHPPCLACLEKLNHGVCPHYAPPRLPEFSQVSDIYATVYLEGMLLRRICV